MSFIGYLLTFLLLTATLHSSYFFLITKKIGLAKWFFFNACAPWSFFYLLGFIINIITKGNKLILATAVPGLLFFAIKGMLVFSWSQPSSQISHLLMLLNVTLALWIIIKNTPDRSSLIGFVLGILILIIFNSFHLKFISQNQPEFDKIMPIK